MYSRLSNTFRIRLGILLFSLALVAGLGTLTGSPPPHVPAGSNAAASLPGGQGTSAPHGPAGSMASISQPAGSTVSGKPAGNGIVVGNSYKNDTSMPLRDIPPAPLKQGPPRSENAERRMALPHKDEIDTVVQRIMAPFAMPTPILNFNGIPYPGVAC